MDLLNQNQWLPSNAGGMHQRKKVRFGWVEREVS